MWLRTLADLLRLSAEPFCCLLGVRKCFDRAEEGMGVWGLHLPLACLSSLDLGVKALGNIGILNYSLGSISSQGVLPVLRTYNTLMIACNICSQPREALRLYDMMRSKGFSPNATTYNTLITAYGKVGSFELTRPGWPLS